MQTPLKTSMLVASLVLVGASATGCGAGGAPTDASEKDFCAHFSSLGEDLGDDPTQKETIATLKKWAEEADEIGTPENISESGREGFEIVIKQVDEVDEDASDEVFEKMNEDLSASDEKAVDAFDKYATETCLEGA